MVDKRSLLWNLFPWSSRKSCKEEGRSPFVSAHVWEDAWRLSVTSGTFNHRWTFWTPGHSCQKRLLLGGLAPSSLWWCSGTMVRLIGFWSTHFVSFKLRFHTEGWGQCFTRSRVEAVCRSLFSQLHHSVCLLCNTWWQLFPLPLRSTFKPYEP